MPRSRLLLAAALAALATPAVAPSDGHATTLRQYSVSLEGSATYNRHDETPSGHGPIVEDAHAKFRFSSTLGTVTLTDLVVSGVVGVGTASATPLEAWTSASIPGPVKTLRGSCSGSTSTGALPGLVANAPIADQTALVVRVLGGYTMSVGDCSGDLGQTSDVLPLGPTGGGALGAGTWDDVFTIPREAIGADTFIQLLRRTVTGTTCPMHRATTKECTLTWNAEVTMRKTFEERFGEEPPAPPVPLPADDPRAKIIHDAVWGPDPRAQIISDAVRRYGEPIQGRSVEQHGGELRFRAACPTGCSGTATVAAAGVSPRAFAARAALARLRFTVPAGKARTVRVKLPRSARRALRRVRAARVTLVLRPKGGGPVARRTLPLRRS